MSGADESNDDLVCGRVNRSNDQTTLWAENHYDTTNIGPIETGSFRVEFNGPAIFVVEVAKDTEEDGEFRPSTPIDAIVGIGWSADWAGQSGGTGVIGVGGEVGGTGMLAKGGEGGKGLHADAGGDATACSRSADRARAPASSAWAAAASACSVVAPAARASMASAASRACAPRCFPVSACSGKAARSTRRTPIASCSAPA